MYAAHCRCVLGTCPLLDVNSHPVADVLHAPQQRCVRSTKNSPQHCCGRLELTKRTAKSKPGKSKQPPISTASWIVQVSMHSRFSAICVVRSMSIRAQPGSCSSSPNSQMAFIEYNLSNTWSGNL